MNFKVRSFVCLRSVAINNPERSSATLQIQSKFSPARLQKASFGLEIARGFARLVGPHFGQVMMIVDQMKPKGNFAERLLP